MNVDTHFSHGNVEFDWIFIFILGLESNSCKRLAKKISIVNLGMCSAVEKAKEVIKKVKDKGDEEELFWAP